MDILDNALMADTLGQLSNFIENKDWLDIAQYIFTKREVWLVLDDYTQAVWKATATGLDQLDLPLFSGHYLNKPYYFSYLKVIE